MELPGWGPEDWVKPGSCLAEVCGLEGHVCGGLDCVKTLEKQHKQLTVLFGNVVMKGRTETELMADCHGGTDVNLVTAIGFYSMFGSLESLLNLEQKHEMVTAISVEVFPGVLQTEQKYIGKWRQEYKERSEQVALTTAVEKVIPARDIPRGQSPMELLTPREMSQTTETRLPAETNRVTIPDPSDTFGDPVVEQTVKKLIETAGRLVANKNAPGSGVTAPYGTIDDTGRVRLSQTVIRQGISDVTPIKQGAETH